MSERYQRAGWTSDDETLHFTQPENIPPDAMGTLVTVGEFGSILKRRITYAECAPLLTGMTCVGVIPTLV